MIQETCLHNLWLLFEGLRSQSLPVPRTLSWLGYQPPPGSVHQTGSVKHSGPPFQPKHHGQQPGISREVLCLRRSPCLWAHQAALLGEWHLFKGTCLTWLDKRCWSAGKAFPHTRLRGNLLAPQFHEDKRIPLGGWTLCAPAQFWFSSLHPARPWVFQTLYAIGVLLRTAWWAMKTSTHSVASIIFHSKFYFPIRSDINKQ